MLLYMDNKTNTETNETKQEDIWGCGAPAKGFRRAGLFWYAVTLAETVAYGVWTAA